MIAAVAAREMQPRPVAGWRVPQSTGVAGVHTEGVCSLQLEARLAPCSPDSVWMAHRGLEPVGAVWSVSGERRRPIIVGVTLAGQPQPHNMDARRWTREDRKVQPQSMVCSTGAATRLLAACYHRSTSRSTYCIKIVERQQQRGVDGKTRIGRSSRLRRTEARLSGEDVTGAVSRRSVHASAWRRQSSVELLFSLMPTIPSMRGQCTLFSLSSRCSISDLCATASTLWLAQQASGRWPLSSVLK